MPGSGDSIQALKAGVMEIPDIIVVNKADHPLTDTMVREIKACSRSAPPGTTAGRCRSSRPRRSAARASPELVEQLDAHRAFIEAEGTLSERRRRNLRSEVARALHAPAAAQPRGAPARGLARSRSCSTRSSRAAWTRRAPRPRSSRASTHAPDDGAPAQGVTIAKFGSGGSSRPEQLAELRGVALDRAGRPSDAVDSIDAAPRSDLVQRGALDPDRRVDGVGGTPSGAASGRRSRA